MSGTEERLRAPVRAALALVGVVLLCAAGPVGFIAAVVSGGGHGSPFDGDWAEATFGAAMLAIPILMIVVGIAYASATTHRRIRIAAALTLLLPLDLAVAFTFSYLAMRPDPVVAYPVNEPQADFTTLKPVPSTGPTHVGIACSVAGDECVTTTTTLTPSGTTTTREAEKTTSAARP